MEMTAAPGSSLPRDLLLQETDTFYSAVTSIYADIKLNVLLTSRTPVETDDPRDALLLSRVRRLLEWTYGHHCRDGRRVRRAPSAGGRYPCEIMVTLPLAGGGRTILYDFEERRFIANSDLAGETAAVAALAPEVMLITILAVTWRTVQRYGVRGYRYCLIDSACLASNLYEVLMDAGGAPRLLSPRVVGQVAEALSLPGGVIATQCLTVPLPVDDLPEPPSCPQMSTSALFNEAPPLLSPAMDRASRFHRQSVRQVRASLLQPVGHDRRTRPPVTWLLDRQSAKAFDQRPLLDDDLQALADWLERLLALDARMNGPVPLRALLIDHHGTRVARLCGNAGVRHLPLPPSVAAEAFQRQAIVHAAAAVIVLGIDQDALSSHCSFTDTTIRVGFAIAELYRHCMGTPWAGTAIGGFSDRQVQRLSGDGGFFPVMAFAVGYPLPAPVKIDAEAWRAVSEFDKGNQR